MVQISFADLDFGRDSEQKGGFFSVVGCSITRPPQPNDARHVKKWKTITILDIHPQQPKVSPKRTIPAI